MKRMKLEARFGKAASAELLGDLQSQHRLLEAPVDLALSAKLRGEEGSFELGLAAGRLLASGALANVKALSCLPWC